MKNGTTYKTDLATRERASKWYYANRERVLSHHRERKEEISHKNKAWCHANKEHVRIKRAAIRTLNQEAWRAREKAYRKKYRTQRCAAENARRARKVEAKGRHSEAQWQARVLFYGWRCRYCAISLNKLTLTRDHLIPLSRGGSNWASNLVPCCRLCNARKRHRTFTEYMKLLIK